MQDCTKCSARNPYFIRRCLRCDTFTPQSAETTPGEHAAKRAKSMRVGPTYRHIGKLFHEVVHGEPYNESRIYAEIRNNVIAECELWFDFFERDFKETFPRRKFDEYVAQRITMSLTGEESEQRAAELLDHIATMGDLRGKYKRAVEEKKRKEREAADREREAKERAEREEQRRREEHEAKLLEAREKSEMEMDSERRQREERSLSFQVRKILSSNYDSATKERLIDELTNRSQNQSDVRGAGRVTGEDE